jgi:hypothetical protein
MDILPFQQLIASAHCVFNGQHGDVSQLARLRSVHRQTLYRQAQAVAHALHTDPFRAQRDDLRQQLLQARQQLLDLQHQQQQHGVEWSSDRLAHFACTAQAEGVSLPVARRLLQVFLAERTPSVARLGRFSHQAAQRAGALLEVLDEHSRPLVHQAAADEVFVGQQPILMVVEQQSLCWQSGRLAERRDGATWACELAKLPALTQLSRDGGTGLAKGVALVNEQRQQAHQPAITEQADHFHLVRDGRRAVRQLHGQVARALEAADQAEAVLRRLRRRGQNQSGAATVAAQRWRQAEAALDRWSAAERAWQRLQEGLRLFTAAGELNSRPQGQALVAAVLPALHGPEWAKVRRQLAQAEVFTFLDGLPEQLAALPGDPEIKQLLVRAEGLQRHPEVTQGEGAGSAALRGVLLAVAVVLSLGGEQVQQLLGLVRGVLRQACRASSVVEGMNSVLRMQQSRHRRLTQGLLDLKRLYWNSRRFQGGRRKEHTPYELLGVSLPVRDWWELLQLTPEQLRQKLSAPNQAA